MDLLASQCAKRLGEAECGGFVFQTETSLLIEKGQHILRHHPQGSVQFYIAINAFYGATAGTFTSGRSGNPPLIKFS